MTVYSVLHQRLWISGISLKHPTGTLKMEILNFETESELSVAMEELES